MLPLGDLRLLGSIKQGIRGSLVHKSFMFFVDSLLKAWDVISVYLWYSSILFWLIHIISPNLSKITKTEPKRKFNRISAQFLYLNCIFWEDYLENIKCFRYKYLLFISTQVVCSNASERWTITRLAGHLPVVHLRNHQPWKKSSIYISCFKRRLERESFVSHSI